MALAINNQMTEKLFPNREDKEVTSMKVNIWFLRFLDKFRTGRESWQEIAMRLITSKKLNTEDSKKLKQELSNYDKFL